MSDTYLYLAFLAGLWLGIGIMIGVTWWRQYE